MHRSVRHSFPRREHERASAFVERDVAGLDDLDADSVQLLDVGERVLERSAERLASRSLPVAVRASRVALAPGAARARRRASGRRRFAGRGPASAARSRGRAPPCPRAPARESAPAAPRRAPAPGARSTGRRRGRARPTGRSGATSELWLVASRYSRREQRGARATISAPPSTRAAFGERGFAGAATGLDQIRASDDEHCRPEDRVARPRRSAERARLR